MLHWRPGRSFRRPESRSSALIAGRKWVGNRPGPGLGINLALIGFCRSACLAPAGHLTATSGAVVLPWVRCRPVPEKAGGLPAASIFPEKRQRRRPSVCIINGHAAQVFVFQCSANPGSVDSALTDGHTKDARRRRRGRGNMALILVSFSRRYEAIHQRRRVGSPDGYTYSATLRRKSDLFSDSHASNWSAALINSIVATVKLHNVEPFAFLKDLLTRLPDHTTTSLPSYSRRTGWA